jgi:hypothetical protein
LTAPGNELMPLWVRTIDLGQPEPLCLALLLQRRFNPTYSLVRFPP